MPFINCSGNKRRLGGLLLAATFLLLAGKNASGQQVSILGANCVAIGTQYVYHIAGVGNWSATGGTISGSSAGVSQVFVTWTSGSSRSISVSRTSPTSGYGIMSIGFFTALSPGTINNTTQNINNGAVPATITCSAASGGDCGTPTYNYQWQSSPTGTSGWTDISGATSQNLSFSSGLTQTMYYQRKVTVTSTGGSGTSNNKATVTVYPAINPGSISPASQTVNYSYGASMLSLTGVSGGTNSYTYQWQTCSDHISWNNIPGATGTTFTPTNITAKMYFRVMVSSNGVSVPCNYVWVDAYPQLTGGSVMPASSNIAYNTSPGPLTLGGVTGGTGTYTYQWQSSANGSSWANISGAIGATYTPGSLTAKTWYHVSVISNGVIINSTPAVITVRQATNDDQNYIRLREIMKPGVTDMTTASGLTSNQDVHQATHYFDGLGRLMQTVAKKALPDNYGSKDLVTMTVYDQYGREATKYLPYASVYNDGFYKNDPLNEQNGFNTGLFPVEQYYDGKVDYEPSPLNRVQKTYAPGQNWVGANRGVAVQNLVNQASDSVRIWTIAAAAGSVPTTTSVYPAGTLYKTQTTDEQNHSIVEYKDKEGKIILKKVQFATTPGTAHIGWLCTYYIYDDLNNLRFVVQPSGIDLVMLNNTWNLNGIPHLTDELCFRYEYDERKRMVIKKVPGAGEVWMVYNARDLLVMTQDSNLRGLGQWLYTEYDNLNRPRTTGLITDSHNRIYHAALAGNSITYPVGLYTSTILTQTLYDDYSWIPTLPVSFTSTRNTAYDGKFLTPSSSFPFPQALTQSNCLRGQVTGMQIATIAGGPILYQINYYDDKARIIQTQQTNITGGTDIATTQYDFSGKILRTYLKQQKSGTNAQTHFLFTRMNYDAGGRLLTLYKKIDDAPADQLISTNTYNELGQLKNKQLGNNLDNLAYEYNIRGWLKSINKDYVTSGGSNYFGMDLGYDKGTAGNQPTQVPQFNGNIASQVWKSAGDGTARKYDYKYDNANRITRAEYSQNTTGSTWDASTLDFSVWGFDSDNGYGIKYDANGNILMMIQSGFKGGTTALIDAMHYTYYQNSNKLQQVWDNVNDPDSKLGDLHYSSTTKTSTDYTYDANGNLIQDNNKKISSIVYNYLNLPQQITITGKGTITYTYDATGAKLSKTTVDNTISPSKTTVTMYQGPFVYQNDTLQFVSHEEGRARWAFHKYTTGTSAYGFEYDFFEKDHLNNTRVVLTQQKDTAKYLASGESLYRTTEAQLFDNLTTTAVGRTTVAGYPNDVTITNPNDTVFKVNGNTGGHKTGPSLLLKVMSGDKIDLGVQEYYKSGSTGTPNTSLGDVLASLATGVVTMTSGAKGSLADLNNTGASPIYAALNSFITNKDPDPSGKPKAYLNWILLDEQLKYVSSYPQSGAIVVGAASTLNNLGYTGIPITKSGYLYIWVSNETPGWDVFFDNLSVKHYSGPLLEETHYYPFGLQIAGLSTKALKPYYAENRIKYNGNELQNKEFSDGTGLEDYDYGARMYDPQIGRWLQIDPLTEYMRRWSSYAYGFNNPLRFADPAGTDPHDSTVNGEPVRVYDPEQEVVVTNQKSHNNNGGFWNSTKNFLWGAVDYIPFAGSIKQIGVGIAHGNWEEAGMGVLMLGIDVVSAGEGGEVLRLGEELVEHELENTAVRAEEEVAEQAEKAIKEVSEKNTATPRKKTAEQLRKEWQEGTGKEWPKEPNDAGKNQVAHHTKPLGDGGHDGYPNIEPLPAKDHTTLHKSNGDFKRWGARAKPKG